MVQRCKLEISSKVKTVEKVDAWGLDFVGMRLRLRREVRVSCHLCVRKWCELREKGFGSK